MYIKSIILDGFKSYGRRTEIHGFDSEFTAITGLNGTGKSNILDSICFVLGISNLVQVRAANLQDLIFKSGQAGVTKAAVTLLFDNSDPNQCPMGYEKCREISVTRQVDVSRKGKYFINGKSVQNKKVTDLFCSVQMNVNNPNFLIMQGRITKVLNMKPPEILSMIEEAAGTSLYESKKEITTKIIEKKDAKLRETSTLLAEEVEPKLEKLRTERNIFIEFQKICRDIEYLTRIHVSHKYLKHKEIAEANEENKTKIHSLIEYNKIQITENLCLIDEANQAIKNIQHQIDNESSAKLFQLDKQLEKNIASEASIAGKIKATQNIKEQENRKLMTLKQSIKDEDEILAEKQLQMVQFRRMFEKLQEASELDAKAYQDAQKRYEALTQGLSTDEDGEAGSLQNQLMNAKQQLFEAQTIIKQTKMELAHIEKVKLKKEIGNEKIDIDYLKDKALLKSISAEMFKLKDELEQINYKEADMNALQERRKTLIDEIRLLISDLDKKNAFRYQLNFNDPDGCIDRRKVHGMVGKLFHVKSREDSLALMMCAGGDLYSYVTEDDITSKSILQRGELARRVTFIPMNKLSTLSMNPKTIEFAQKIVGKENVTSALSLIEYQDRHEKVMQYVFGRVFVCKTLDTAKQITYHPNIMCRSVTLDGDVIDPEGTLSGGATPSGANILDELEEIMKIDTKKEFKENELHQIEKEIQNLRNIAKNYNIIKNKVEVKQIEFDECSNRLALTAFRKNQEEIQELGLKIETLKHKIGAAECSESAVKIKLKDIEAKINDSKGFREEKLKSAQSAMKAAKHKSESSKSNWKRREQEFETLHLEIEDIKKSLSTANGQLNDLNDSLVLLNNTLIELKSESSHKHTEISEIKREIEQRKDTLNSQSMELKAVILQKQKLEAHIQDLELENKRKENEVTKINNEMKEIYNRIKELESSHLWIREDKEFFGIKNTRYDYSKENPNEASKKLSHMLEKKEKMERNVNTRALMLLDREEEQYSEAMRRKKIVEDDKEKLKYIIKKMDEKKVEKIENAWRDVNRNFSNIFSTLLPGAQSQLQPVYQANALYGLKIRVGFNNVWKESLGELSGGQRSLVALSLVLAMLKFSPAPIYILDEVDAALDMSHTQNIGNMLKEHFKNSQFIIVSLKDGMFNNANVLFRTKFEEGVSSVMRTVNLLKNR